MPKNNFVTELVNAFNLRNYYFDDVNTNFTVKGNKIVGLFASDVEVKKYFQAVRKEIIKRHYGTEEAAGEYYKLDYFPFVFDVNSKWKAKERAIREVELADSTNNEVIRNLKIYFAKEFQRVVEAKVIKNLETSARMTKKKACECLEGSVLEEIDRYSPYLYCISFNDRYFKESGYPPRFFEAFRGMYISAFDLKLEEYGFNDSSIFYEQRDNKLYIRDITNINVVKNVAKHVRGRIALDFKTPGTEDFKVENFKDVLRDLVFKKVGKPINAYDYGVFIDEKQRKNGHSFALIPLEERKYDEFYSLGLIDAIKIDPNVLNLFKNSDISNVVGKIANPQFANCKGSVYAFSNKQIAQLLPKIMEYPIAYNEINGRFEFAVDLENFRSRHGLLSPEPPRTPPNQRKKDTDSGYDSNSPPKPKDSVAHSSSGGPGPSTELSDTEWESPTRSKGGVKDSPRQGSEKEEGEEGPRLLNYVNSVRTSDRPLTDLSYATTSCGVPGISRDLSAGEGTLTEASIGDSYFLPSMLTSFPHGITPLVHSVLTTRHDSMFPNHEFFARSSCFEDKNILSMKSEEHDKSEQGACSQVGVRALEGDQADDESMLIKIQGQQVSYRSSGPYIRGGKRMQSVLQRLQLSSSKSSSFRPSSIPSPIAWNDSTFLNPEVSNEEPEKQQVTKEKEEEKLFKALLYWFNLNNYALDPPHTNFIVKNGKIASLIDDGVDVKEYLQEIIDKTKEEYRVNKEEAYDFNEFPFQFLSNCEKNQETTVVANISRGALLNLKELFSREHEGKVEIKDIDINIVEKAVKSEKDKWVNFQVQEHGLSPKKAIKTCYPDKSVLEYISITKDKGGYWINRDYDGSEVKSFRGERWLAKGTSKAEKMKPEDNKDSGYSSGFVTDAENVSSKAEATTSGYESMDCENTRGGSPKRTLELSVGMEELTISTDLYATKAEQHSPIKKFRSN